MIKTVHKWFWVWDFDKEEAWLNDMAARGLALHSVGWCRYDFEEAVPGEYKVAMEMLDNNTVENESYIRFLEETGVEHIGGVSRWAYFRRKGAGEFRLRSGYDAEIRYLTRVIRFMAVFFLLNLANGLNNLNLYRLHGMAISLIGWVCLALALLLGCGIIRLWVKRRKLKKDAEIFE